MVTIIELGVVVALLASLVSALRDAFQKKLTDGFTSVEIGFIGQVYGVVLLAPLTLYVYLTSEAVMTSTVFLSILVVSTCIVLAFYFFIEALRDTDISIVSPLRRSTPIVVALLEPLVLGVSYRSVVLLAGALGTVGAYVLMADEGFMEPILNLRERGAQMALASTFVFAISAISLRYGTTNYDTILFTYLVYLLGLVGFWFLMVGGSHSVSRPDYLDSDMIWMGSLNTVAAVMTFYAFSLISASEVTIVKQTTGIFGILVGGAYFRESELLRKLIGTLIVIAGVVLVVLY